MKKFKFLIAFVLICANSFSQNVGIGINNPTKAKLVVKGNQGANNYETVAIFGDSAAGVSLSNNPGIGFNMYFGNGQEKTINAGYGGGINFNTANGATFFHSSSASAITDGVLSMNTNMVITGSGNVGIGTTSPVTKLQIEGGTDASYLSNSGYLVTGNTLSANLVIDENEILARYGGGTAPLYLQAGGGNVGIGSSNTPQAKLHIDGGTDASYTANSGYLITGNVSGVNIVMDNNEILARNNGAASSLYLQAAGGNVAIGNISPTALLDVSDVIRIRGGNPGAGKILMSSSNGTASWRQNPSFKMRSTVNISIPIPELTWITVPFNVKDYDFENAAYVDGSPANENSFVAPVTGVYHFDATCFWNLQTMVDQVRIAIYKNTVSSGNSIGAQWYQVANTHFFSSSVSCEAFLTAGTKVFVSVFHFGSGQDQLLDLDPRFTSFSGHLVSTH